MAKNLQSKLTASDKVSIFDINPEAMKGLEKEMKATGTGAAIELATSAHDASKDAVSFALCCCCCCFWGGGGTVDWADPAPT
jgi:3-hydroxyisobutyrate dehydrogenase